MLVNKEGVFGMYFETCLQYKQCHYRTYMSQSLETIFIEVQPNSKAHISFIIGILYVPSTCSIDDFLALALL